MFCPYCQNQLPSNAAVCPSCGTVLSNANAQQQQPQPQPQPQPIPPQPQPQPEPPQRINTWLVPSILVTLCCCLPFGIVAIVFASKANACLGTHDYEGAQKAANTAKMWFWIALGTGIVTNTIAFILQVAAAGMSD